MTVSVYQEGDDLGDGNICVEGYFEHLDALKIVLVKENNPLVSYLVLRGVGDPEENEHFKAIMELTNARSVNLWYECHQEGMTLVRDIDRVVDLEECLRHYEIEQRGRLQ